MERSSLMPTIEHIWHNVTKRLQAKLPQNEFRIWFSRAALKRLEEDSAVISVPNRFHALWLSEKYLPSIEECLAKTLRNVTKVSFSYERAGDSRGEPAPARSGLDSSMNFAGLLNGDWNRFAYSSAVKVSEGTSRPYNPLYIFARPGLGKTHLLHAIGNRILSKRPETAVKHVSCDAFISEFNGSCSNDQQQSFEELYSLLDVLLFDDVHLLYEQPKAQNALVLILDSLYSRNKAIVLTGDRPPQELSGISRPLQSRLGWGVLAQMHTPSQSALMEIIRAKAEENGAHLPEDVVFLLSNGSRDIRALTRNIVKLKTYASLKGSQINLSTAMALIKGSGQSRIGVEDIKSITAGYFNIPVDELASGGKKRTKSYPRQVAMYLARKYTDLSFKEIGTSFGHKDHSTVIYAIRRIEEQRGQGKSTTEDLIRIENLLS